MIDELTSELLDLTASFRAGPPGRSRCWRCVAAAAVAAAVAGPTESADAASAPACAVVPPRRGRRPAPARARPVGRRPRGRRRARPVSQRCCRCSTARARSRRSSRGSARRRPRPWARHSTCSRRTDCSSTARRRLGPWRASAAIAAAYGLAPAVAADRLRAATVGVAGESGAAEQIARLLHADGVGEVRRLTWDEHDVDLAVVAPAPDEVSRAARLEPARARARPPLASRCGRSTGSCSRSGRSSFPASPAVTSASSSGLPRMSSTAPI